MTQNLGDYLSIMAYTLLLACFFYGKDWPLRQKPALVLLDPDCQKLCGIIKLAKVDPSWIFRMVPKPKHFVPTDRARHPSSFCITSHAAKAFCQVAWERHLKAAKDSVKMCKRKTQRGPWRYNPRTTGTAVISCDFKFQDSPGTMACRRNLPILYKWEVKADLLGHWSALICGFIFWVNKRQYKNRWVQTGSVQPVSI